MRWDLCVSEAPPWVTAHTPSPDDPCSHAPGEVTGNNSGRCIPDTHMGDSCGVPASQLRPGPLPAVAGMRNEPDDEGLPTLFPFVFGIK